IRPTGEAPSDLSVADFNGDGQPDLAVSNQASGDVSVLLNDAAHTFATGYLFRAGTGLYGLDTSGTTPTFTAVDQSVSRAAGESPGRGRNELVVVDGGTHSFTILPNDGSGGFGMPRVALTPSTSEGPAVNRQPGTVVAGDFTGDGAPDLAVL